MPSQTPSVRGLPKVVLIELCRDLLVTTDGSTTFRRLLLDVPELRDLVVRAASMRVHWMGEGFTANFEAKLDMDWSVTGELRSTPVDLIAAQNTAGAAQAIGSELSARANFGLHPRVAIASRNEAGSAIESGRITAILELVLLS
jgi:hypothetical protein